MSEINREPFIVKVLKTLTIQQIETLSEAINGQGPKPVFRSLLSGSPHLLTLSDAGVKPMNLEVAYPGTAQRVYGGYLIYTGNGINQYCTMISFSDDMNQGLFLLDMKNKGGQWFHKILPCELSITELRSELNDLAKAEEKEAVEAVEDALEDGSLKIKPDYVNSGSATAGQVLAADGEGGAEFVNASETLKEAGVETGDAVKLLGFDSNGNLVNDDIPEGITVDETIIENSPNAVAGGAVYKALQDVDTELDTKANVDGNYPTLTAGLADNLTPYSEDSGAEQENPFISNGTGTNNNTEIVTVGDYSLLKEKQGNTVAVNQGIENNNFASTSGWFKVGPGDGSISVSNNILTFTTTHGDTGIRKSDCSFIDGHKYLTIFNVKTNVSGAKLQAYTTFNPYKLTEEVDSVADTWQTIFGILTASTTSTFSLYLYCNKNSGVQSITAQYKKPVFVDLTHWFNGDIPQELLDNPSHFSWYYNGSLAYNTGSLGNANGVKLVSTKRNLFNGLYSATDKYLDANGNEISQDATGFNITEYIIVPPNKPIWVSRISGTVACLCFYDKDKNFISSVKWSDISSTKIVTTPPNCVYIRDSITTSQASGLDISLYYTPEEGGEGYDKHYDYEESYVVETGNEILRSAGSVKDTKAPDSTITRNVKNYTFALTNASRIERGSSGQYYFGIGPAAIKNYIKGGTQNATFSNGIVLLTSSTFTAAVDKTGYVANDGTIYVYLDACKTMTVNEFVAYINGTEINFELATPTTEQGTPFAENLPIHDYGMLYWLDSSNNLVGIPQGCKIFYQTNYKGFTDDMYMRVDGDASKYLVDSDKIELQGIDTQLKNALGGTLRQLLATKESLDFDNTDVVDLGTLTWAYASDYNYFYATLSGIKQIAQTTDTIGMLCTKYKSVAQNVWSQNRPCVCKTTSGEQILIGDANYTDATTFKAAMKGVLLAYEKASE